MGEMTTSLTGFTLAQASELVRTRSISPTELTRACLKRIEELNPVLNAYITIAAEQALAQAHELEAEQQRGEWRGPLHGIPIAVKDNIETAGIPTTSASGVFAGYIPSEDAEVVRRLKAAGAILLGKHNMHQVAFGATSAISHYGAVRNPWKLDRSPGGSSGGSAAAVATDLCYGAVATDGGGSIRLPAAFCGIVGLKPSYGRVSTRGGGEGWWSVNHLGPICRTVADAALLLSAIAGYDPEDSASIDAPLPDYTAALRARTSELRLGIPRAPFYEALDPEIETAMNQALERLRHLTADLREVDLPAIPAELTTHIILAETYAFHAPYLAKMPQLYDVKIRGYLESGSEVTTASYIQARRDLDRLRRTVGSVFSRVDLLVMPTTAVTPPAIGEPESLERDLKMIRNTWPFNVYGLPTLSIPCGFTTSGLPIGLQISGPHLGEEKVLALAHAYEQATDWHKRRPAL
jgi:aspartyl-tRNA(Asn)/glutamyl-tRNA(Gln) amidotransferase subunit A